MTRWYCNKCRILLKKPYRINVFTRDPNKKYFMSNLPVVHTDNEQYCKKHFEEVIEKIRKTL